MFYVGVEGEEERRGVIKVGSVNNRHHQWGRGIHTDTAMTSSIISLKKRMAIFINSIEDHHSSPYKCNVFQFFSIVYFRLGLQSSVIDMIYHDLQLHLYRPKSNHFLALSVMFLSNFVQIVGFVKNVTWISLSCYMVLSKLIHVFL